MLGLPPTCGSHPPMDRTGSANERYVVAGGGGVDGALLLHSHLQGRLKGQYRLNRKKSTISQLLAELGIYWRKRAVVAMRGPASGHKDLE
jgi:hypothetical protein